VWGRTFRGKGQVKQAEQQKFINQFAQQIASGLNNTGSRMFMWSSGGGTEQGRDSLFIHSTSHYQVDGQPGVIHIYGFGHKDELVIVITIHEL
jgi:hypothetical protein